MPSLAAMRADFARRFNRAGNHFPQGNVTSYVRTGGQARYSQHRYGLAADVSFRPLPPERWPVAEFKQRMAAEGLYVIDERKRTSANWTGPHLHVQRYDGSRFKRLLGVA